MAGVPASFYEAGSGAPVVYLHGFPTSGYLWRKVIDVVSQSYRCVAPDIPGFGESELLPKPHTWAELRDWIGSFVSALELGSFHLAVHDWGGLIGLPWFCDNYEEVSSLLITDTSFSSRDRWHALAQQWREPGVGEEMLGDMDEQGFKLLVSAMSPEIEDEAINKYFGGLRSVERRIAKLEMYRSLEFEMFEPYMAIFPEAARGKARVIWGELDPFLPTKVASRFGERLDAEVTVLEGAGHFLQEDRGRDLGMLHLEFLDSMGAN